MPTPTVIVHGGAGAWKRESHRKALRGVEAAARYGVDVLQKGGSALDAVESAIVSLEDNPVFNAGTGSTLNLSGEIENDAAIMDGNGLKCGAVALVHRVKNPIRLARLVMEETDHVLLAGTTAEKLADAFNLERANLEVRKRRDAWNRERRKLLEDSKSSYFKKNVELKKSGLLPGLMDTVGGLALDSSGRIAAGASTGGISLKLPGRIGDTALIGAGLYADSSLGAATATGVGELAIRTNISKNACDLIKAYSPQRAAMMAVQSTNHRVGPGLGIIALDKKGRWGVSHDTRNLCWAVAGRALNKSGMKGHKL